MTTVFPQYVNSGAGGLAGAFVHEKNRRSVEPALLGWWGHDLHTRFQMNNRMELQPGVKGFRLSNQPVLLVCPLQASLEVFQMTSMQSLRRKSVLLTGYLEHLLQRLYGRDPARPHGPHIRIITPSDPRQRGCQLSLCFSVPVADIFHELERRGVAVSTRDGSLKRREEIKQTFNRMACAFKKFSLSQRDPVSKMWIENRKTHETELQIQ
ncbi:Kynureninase [Liparis tanakae]|uniref:Kynureninase n=1 Tax=Liparis tanakae TaxID=230148 RepID=A0A4Z2E5M1_9TELE|nr:Kynureninase [Liparis tanakae]